MHPRRVFLLGASADHAECEYGWIEPGSHLAHDAFAVRGFLEKPEPLLAQQLLRQHWLWNTFVMVGSMLSFEMLLRTAAPGLVERFAPLTDRRGPAAEDAVSRLVYQSVQPIDFSTDVLARSIDRLGVVPLVQGGWLDLGLPGPVRMLITALREPRHAVEPVAVAAG